MKDNRKRQTIAKKPEPKSYRTILLYIMGIVIVATAWIYYRIPDPSAYKKTSVPKVKKEYKDFATSTYMTEDGETVTEMVDAQTGITTSICNMEDGIERVVVYDPETEQETTMFQKKYIKTIATHHTKVRIPSEILKAPSLEKLEALIDKKNDKESEE